MKINKSLAGLTGLVATLFLAACGGSGGGGGGGGAVTFNCDGSGSVALTGTATFEDVPAGLSPLGGVRLNYQDATFKPIREAEVVIECADGSQVYAETVTDASGAFSASVPENVDARIVVRARSVRTVAPAWDLEVVDNTSGQAVWAVEGDSFATGTGSINVDIAAGSGWNSTSTSYNASERISGAFSIYDVAYEAMQLVLSAEPGRSFAPLTVNWSPANTASCRSSRPHPDGCIGTSFYTQNEIYVLGDADEDTDEFDDSVVAHEWGHYYEDNMARSDSVGGPHGGGDLLDIRVAFGEGFGNAFSGMVTNQQFYYDTSGNNQASGFRLGLEQQITSPDGWFNETSIQLILFDLYDSNADASDTLSLGFGPLHTVLTTHQRNTPAFTSIFPFVYYLEVEEGVSGTAIANLLSDHDIAPVSDIYGQNRSNKGPVGVAQVAVDPVYLDISSAIASGATTQFCVTDEYGSYNKLGNRRFARFTVSTTGTYAFELDGSAGLPGSDPDFYIFRNGNLEIQAAADSSGSGIETTTGSLEAGVEYVADVHEWLNIDSSDANNGDTCLDFTVNLQ